MKENNEGGFNRYQIFVVAILAFLQFTIVLDFMVLSPLGAILLSELSISTSQFGLVVSAYAFSAGASGILSAGYADKYDRKKLLLFFYVGFIMGTFLCSIAPGYTFLLWARILTGLFGGVIGSISFAIVTDLFPLEKRGRVMGFVQMAFGLSQVLGIPVGLYLATHWDWHTPFQMIVIVSIIIGIVIFTKLRPIDDHLRNPKPGNAFQHLLGIVTNRFYLKGFAATTLLATGGFMLMPFGSAYGVQNLGISLEKLPLLYMVTGLCMLIFSPLIGTLSDKTGKYPMFVIGSIITSVMTLIYCNLSITPLWIIMILNVLLFVGISGRMIAASALMTAIPSVQDRGGFMGINASVQQIAGGIASLIAGFIVSEGEDGKIQNYPTLGFVVVIAVVITIFLMRVIHQNLKSRNHEDHPHIPSTQLPLNPKPD
ncbi:MFS transporter [Dyadobacter tibetensis]|uniref:MFS transporter n=1 Tax=Dyadobacter tibetensis TaxID=1211851 RepID=UPI0004B37251|nr:MFS transporter [Dyadobacter tibetensis]